MGHIELAAPVSHIWYFKGIPSRMGLLLDMSPRALERVLYFASYIVLETGNTDLQEKELLSEGQYRYKKEQWGRGAFRVGMGAEAIETLLKNLDLDALSEELRKELSASSGQKRLRAIRRLEVVEAFRKSGNRPEWMILNVIPVIPPELRPMVQLDGGRFATSDLNDLYRRVINRNNRLRRLLNLKAPDIIVRNEKRMLQEAVDALIDNGRRGRPVTGPGNRPLKSLSDMLKGKQGRFRQNLLGKRVDYSGRSVIVVGPELKLHQCGLPKEMALELFKPFVMKKLSSDFGLTIKAAKKKVDRANAEVWAVLEEVIKEHPVLLNRAPTLHRLGIQAFEPVLTEGRALKLHPLACTAYNADFDGDQMAIHLPLSAEAQAEARVLMLAANHILAPKDGKPIIVPTQDMVLGTYYLTKLRKGAIGEGRTFTGINEAIMAHERGELHLQAEIRVRLKREDLPKTELLPPTSKLLTVNELLPPTSKLLTVNELLPPTSKLLTVKTSLGRLIFNEKLPASLRAFSMEPEPTLGKVMNKKELGKLVAACYKEYGATRTAEVIDAVKKLGYHYACLAGMTVAMSDCIVPPAKGEILARTSEAVKKIEGYYNRGILTERERYEKVIELWKGATDEVADAMMANMDEFNPIYMMSDSGARGNKQQMRQLAGMRGLMADPSGKIIDLPITANFREGLSVSDYFISSHGARKGLADTALRTADSGYLTRRLVDVAQDVIVREDDCDIETVNLKLVRAQLAEDTFDALEILSEELIGRVIAADVIKRDTGEVAIKAETVLTEEKLIELGESGAPSVILRGTNLSEPDAVNHVRVTEEIMLGKRDALERERLREAFLREYGDKELVGVIRNDGTKMASTLPLEVLLNDERIIAMQIRHNNIKGIEVEAITEGSRGVIESLKERIVGRFLAEEIYDPNNGARYLPNTLVTEELAERIALVREKVRIRSVLTCKSRQGVCKKCYGWDLSNRSEVEVGEAVGIIAAQSIGEPGTQLTMRTFHTGGVAGGDITQGLPRVEELFEARKPKMNAIISEISGVVSEGGFDKNGLRVLAVEPIDGANQQRREYSIPYGVQTLVKPGDEIKAGERITAGPKNPHDILRISGLKETHRYLVKEVQKVYKSQGVEINDKHIEVMVRQMLHKVTGEPPSAENAASLLNSLFFDPRRYDLANVGRFKLNFKLGLKNRSSKNCFSKSPLRFFSDFGKFSSFPASDSSSRKIAISDIISAISFLFELFAGIAKTDDIDHLGNRRVRAVGELLQNQFRIGMTRMERVVKERMTTQDSDILTPQNLINIRPVVASIKEFFGSSQLSQFMDQHNPLSELTHKRRLSALGPGGLSRERAGFEVRDVHISHYGRMCPIETPEGPNIGLIGSLSNFAIINKFGFIEAPYRIVDKINLKVSNNVIYLDALQEEDKIIAQANEPLINDWFQNQAVTARFHEVTAKFDPMDVDLMDVSPKQVVSCASALIPFLQNDDANRALMGANMQRQAVPLLKTQPPLVGTAMEHIAAAHSGVILASKQNATVANVDSRSISLIANNKTSVFFLRKFSRSNQGTCFNQRPIVHIGQKLKSGQPFADGPATHNAELALGFNVIVAYMPWEGFNYEDAILLNQNLLKYDIFSSIHIEEFQCDARDTKLGPEEVTRDIPNLSDDALANLDSDGIISIGSDVQTGDILGLGLGKGEKF